MRNVLRAARIVAEAERRQHAPLRNIEPVALLIFADSAAETSAASRFSRNGTNLNRSSLEPLVDALSARQPVGAWPENAFGKNRSNLS
jgi:hypothetical protein